MHSPPSSASYPPWNLAYAFSITLGQISCFSSLVAYAGRSPTNGTRSSTITSVQPLSALQNHAPYTPAGDVSSLTYRSRIASFRPASPDIADKNQQSPSEPCTMSSGSIESNRQHIGSRPSGSESTSCSTSRRHDASPNSGSTYTPVVASAARNAADGLVGGLCSVRMRNESPEWCCSTSASVLALWISTRGAVTDAACTTLTGTLDSTRIRNGASMPGSNVDTTSVYGFVFRSSSNIASTLARLTY